MKINQKYGYVRVSSKSQELNSSLESQKHQLIQNGIKVENIRIAFFRKDNRKFISF